VLTPNLLAEKRGNMSCQQLGASLVLLMCCLLCGCAASPNVLKNSTAPDGSVAGFWLGLWHGMILPISFIVALFRDSVNVYEVHNNGGWYNFGFQLGAAIVLGGGGGTASSGKTKT
jgi:hypothetical protein